MGLNEPILSRLPGGKIYWSLEQYIDHALLLSGSSYNVGVAKEERNNHPVSAKPESAHIVPATPKSTGPVHVMAVMTEPHRKMAATPESLAKMAATPEPCQVTAVAKIFPMDFFWGGYSTQGPVDAELGPRLKGLIASVMDLPLISVQAAGISRELSTGCHRECSPELSASCYGGRYFVRVGCTLHS